MRVPNALLGCGHPSGPLFHRRAAPGSPFSCPASSLPMKSSSCPSTKQPTEAFSGGLPLSQSFAFSTPVARIRPFHTPCTPLSSRLPRKYSGMAHAGSVRHGRRFPMRYSYGPVPKEGGTPHNPYSRTNRLSQGPRPGMSCPFPCWLSVLHASVVRSARGRR